MKISTQGRYTVRCVLNVALRGRNVAVPISEISREEEISSNYIEQLFLKLKERGIMSSVRGRNGGYRLSRDTAEISIAEIIEAVEGPIVTVECIKTGDCERMNICTTKFLWEKISKEISDILAGISLADMCVMARNAMGKGKIG